MLNFDTKGEAIVTGRRDSFCSSSPFGSRWGYWDTSVNRRVVDGVMCFERHLMSLNPPVFSRLLIIMTSFVTLTWLTASSLFNLGCQARGEHVSDLTPPNLTFRCPLQPGTTKQNPSIETVRFGVAASNRFCDYYNHSIILSFMLRSSCT